MKHFSVVKSTILFLLFFIISGFIPLQQTRAQDMLYKKSKIFDAYADNYYPKINEPVKITIHFTSPGDYEKGRFVLGFSKRSFFKIISGDNTYQKSLHKGENVTMNAYVKFLKKGTFAIDAFFGKGYFQGLAFYVGGAFLESQEVRNLRFELERLKNAIENHKNKQTQIPNELLYSTHHYNKDHKQKIRTHSKYQKSIIKELEKKNIELFNTLEKEIDSLRKEGEKLNKSLKMKYLPPPPPEDTLQKPKWQRKERATTISTKLNITEIRAIKLHETPYVYFYNYTSTGQYIPLSNIRIEPSTLGSITVLEDNSFIFKANAIIGSGTFYL